MSEVTLVRVSDDVWAFPIGCRDELLVTFDVGGAHRIKVDVVLTRAEIVALLEAFDSQ